MWLASKGGASHGPPEQAVKEALNNLLRAPIAASRARSLLAYLHDVSRRSLRGSLHSGLLATVLQTFLKGSEPGFEERRTKARPMALTVMNFGRRPKLAKLRRPYLPSDPSATF